jgi:hypothetical protein
MRVAASATGCAPVASVLRPCPVANTRVRADSLGGTSTTCSPSASSRFARCLPIPWHPSTAQIRSGQCFTFVSIAAYPAASVAYRPPPRMASSPAMISMVAERLCGSILMTTRFIPVLLPDPAAVRRGNGRAPLLRAEQTPLEPLPAPRQHPARAGQIRATRPAWAADVRATNRVPRPSLARHRS